MDIAGLEHQDQPLALHPTELLGLAVRSVGGQFEFHESLSFGVSHLCHFLESIFELLFDE